MKNRIAKARLAARMAGSLAATAVIALPALTAYAQDGGGIGIPGAPVPVPATLALVGLGIGALIVAKRRK